MPGDKRSAWPTISTNEIFLGFTNIFEYFNEVDFLMDDVIGGCRSDKES